MTHFLSGTANVVKTTKGQRRQMRLQTKREGGYASPYAYDASTRDLLMMLRTMRPAGSFAEQAWVDEWIAPLGTEPDGFGNHWLTIGDGSSRILWSCHTDTVHNKGGGQFVAFHDGCAYVKRSNCLGADDTTGVWLMREMVMARVPGTYVFHREEEIGGLGSSWIAQNTPERLYPFDYAIAFDRKGYSDIIVSQGPDTASNGFAASLADALAPLPYMSADGIFTDTAVYAHIIPECSNISVGYHKQHTTGEWQDIDFAMHLRDRLITADFSRLRAARDPQVESYSSGGPWGRTLVYDNVAPVERDDDSWMWEPDGWYRDDDGVWRQDTPRGDAQTLPGRLSLDTLVREHPEAVADFLASCGYTVDDLLAYMDMDNGGRLTSQRRW